jgi:hypothetical protein
VNWINTVQEQTVPPDSMYLFCIKSAYVNLVEKLCFYSANAGFFPAPTVPRDLQML